jgi:tripartite-type tricarboxylate transporter receptor subunit TctC
MYGRRGVLVTLCCAAVTLLTPAAVAQTYPVRAVRIVVPNAPGSSGDIVARLIAPPLGERLGQLVIVDNRAGAGTMIGGEAVAKAPPDGYTLLMAFSTLAINPATYKKVPYDALRDFAPITQLASLPALIAAHPSLPAKSIKELIALARARPGAITFSSTGQGTYSHVCSELLMSMAGIRMLHVPYKGTGPSLAAALSGEVAVTSANILSALPHVRSGRLRALGITSLKRATSAPDIPTVAEAGLQGYESVQWLGLLAPAATPREIIARVYKDSITVLRSADVQERLAKDGAEAVGSSPEQFSAYIRAETVKWAKVLKSAGIVPE